VKKQLNCSGVGLRYEVMNATLACLWTMQDKVDYFVLTQFHIELLLIESELSSI